MNFWIALLMFYLATLAALHAWAEYRGRLWRYFGAVTGVDWLSYWDDRTGLKVFVLPALLLQLVAIIGAFWPPLMGTGDVHGWWLSLLIGACIGDAIFSHFIPSLKLWPNPGHGSAILYLVNSLALILFCQEHLTVVPAFLGAGFFALVLPVLFRTRWQVDD